MVCGVVLTRHVWHGAGGRVKGGVEAVVRGLDCSSNRFFYRSSTAERAGPLASGAPLYSDEPALMRGASEDARGRVTGSVSVEQADRDDG